MIMNIQQESNPISVRQNEEGSIDLLAAMRQMYYEAKNASSYQFLICVALPITFPLLKTFSPSNPMYLGTITLLSILVIIINDIFEKVVREKKEKAARYQELFDTKVLELDWNEDLCGPKEKAMKHLRSTALKYKKKNASLENLKNWYPTVYSNVDIAAGRVMCQKVNTSWDSEVRNAYQKYLFILFFGSVVLLITVALVFNKTVFETLTSILVPLFPIGYFIYKRYAGNQNTIYQLEKVSDKAESLWERLIENSSRNLGIHSRKLQNEIYKHRSSALMVSDWFYFRNRNQQEEDMNEIAKVVVDTYKKSKPSH